MPPTKPTVAVETLTDAASLLEESPVPCHVDSQVVDSDTVDALAAMDDVAVVGVTDEDGRVLLRKLDPDCAWKLPLSPVGNDDDAGDVADAAHRAVEGVVGLPVALDGIEGVWRLEAREQGEGETARTASREFVVVSASAAPDAPALDDVAADDLAGVGWFETLPANAERAPGTDLFFE